MTTLTFLCEWDNENLASMVVAEESLRKATSDIRRCKLNLACRTLGNAEDEE